MKKGEHFKKNQQKLEDVTDLQWATAIEKCRVQIDSRIKYRTERGAHSEARLGMDPYDYYLSYAYDAILLGNWEWKDEYTLSQQMIRIADSTMSTEVEKVKTKRAKERKVVSMDGDDMFFVDDPDAGQPDMVREILFNKKISVIEELIKGNEEMENFWECVKDGMKTTHIADYMEKTPRQIYKIQERFVRKIKESHYFEDL